VQNTSHAVMAQRTESLDSLDDFPTPPWATRALIEHVLDPNSLKNQSCLEPACGAGHMSKVLHEYFAEVCSVDIHDYGYGVQGDFLCQPFPAKTFDWVITNPPFRLAEEFIHRAMPIAKFGIAMLVRTVFTESVGRYERLFKNCPPTKVAQFAERVPMVKGRLDRKASTATGYCWIVWETANTASSPEMVWIPPCRKALERDSDYDAVPTTKRQIRSPHDDLFGFSYAQVDHKIDLTA
jgi:hypothetical protein